MKTEKKHTPGKWVIREVNDLDFSHEIATSIKDKDCIAAIYRLHKSHSEAESNAQLIASAPELKQRVTDMEMVITNFITHVEENRGNYFPEELKKLRDLVAIERPYYPPVTYHDNWSGKEMTTEND